MGKRNRFTAVATAVVAVAGLAGTASLPAHAAAEGTKAAAAKTYYLHFDKSTNTNSRLYLKQTGTNKVIASFRAGSGVTTNECTRNKGWLPTKSYTIKKWNTNYNGSLIKGYAFQLNDTKCKNGSTPRTELFIHSEMTRNGGQGSTEPTRWDGVGDYKSAGCIKMHPKDIKELYKRAKAVGFPKKLVVTN
ncbi:L,D-transpeptidase [Streptomyces adelaidensis]|uniref:L,D-transpeptidase n=1 Tax=Streptomyces adelaidensis TaxID=2796465 RepID=UPI001905D729|nr:L,D-transpeptidase [Streptomyces adelaidensis]